jgi:predicted nucleotidyltransferase
MLDLPATLPLQKRDMLTQLVDELQRVPGVAAVVLGGSYARGTQRPDSDLDVGIYYAAATPFAIAEMRRIARSLSVNGEPVVTEFYGWGPWVNGGAWIYTAAGKVDFLYRNLDQIQRTLDDAQRGTVIHDYDQQPAYGFYSVIYLAETQVCLPLFDPAGRIADLKRQVAVYPPALKARVVADALWSAEFTLIQARTFAAAGDVYNTVGCLTRVAAALTQALFALNEVYFMSDKKVLETIRGFSMVPPDYGEQIQALLAHPGQTVSELEHTVTALVDLWAKVMALAEGGYQPKFLLQGGISTPSPHS